MGQSDEVAVERYRYLLRTAPADAIEQVHTEAFSRLTPEQRELLFEQLTANAPAGEAPQSDAPNDLARSATRSELREPGMLERSFSGPSFGSMLGASLLGTVAGYVIGSAIVSAFLPMDAGSGGAGADGPGDAASDAPADASSADAGGGDFGSADFGGDFGF